MLTLQCTKKLADLIKLKQLEAKPEHQETLFGWHAHFTVYQRKTYVFVMNNEARFGFLMKAMTKADFKHFHERLLREMELNLKQSGMKSEWIKAYLQQLETVRYTPTSDRSLISQMNEMLRHVNYIFEQNIEVYGDLSLGRINHFFTQEFIMLKYDDLPHERMAHALQAWYEVVDFS